MKYLVVLFVSFYQLDLAVADDSAAQSGKTTVKLIEEQLEKMSKLTVFSLKIPPRIVRSFQNPILNSDQSPLSCDLHIQPNRNDVQMDYSCDAIKTIKTESLEIAAN